MLMMMCVTFLSSSSSFFGSSKPPLPSSPAPTRCAGALFFILFLYIFIFFTLARAPPICLGGTVARGSWERWSHLGDAALAQPVHKPRAAAAADAATAGRRK